MTPEHSYHTPVETRLTFLSSEQRVSGSILADSEKGARKWTVLLEQSCYCYTLRKEDGHSDLVARGPNESVVVEIKAGIKTAAFERFREIVETIQRHPGWKFSLVVIDPRSDEVAPATQQLLDQKEVADRLKRANELLSTGTADAAFLLLWTSVEALPRLLG